MFLLDLLRFGGLGSICFLAGEKASLWFIVDDGGLFVSAAWSGVDHGGTD